MTTVFARSVGRRGVLLERDFVSPEVCGRLIRFFQENIARLGFADAARAFTHRVINYSSIDEALATGAEVKRIMRAVRFLAAQRIIEWFGVELVLPERTQLVVWPEGTRGGLHRDLVRRTTTYASIIYLNDDYTGGETIFAEYPAVSPRTGTMVAFHGVLEEHGVAEIRAGTRYTMPMWFTDSRTAAES